MGQNKINLWQPIALLKVGVETILSHPLILYPFVLSAIVQLICFEILYFAPRFPLVVFFGPIIKRLWNESFLHYPFNLILLPKLFYYAQLTIFVFLGAFLAGVAVTIIKSFNLDKKITPAKAFAETLPHYLNIFISSILFLLTLNGFYKIYDVIFKRAVLIKSEIGIFGFLKKAVILGAPVYLFLIAVIVTTLFAFVIPSIVLEKRKIFAAIVQNFKRLWKVSWVVLTLVLLPNLLYVPVLLLRNSISSNETLAFPEVHVLVVALGIIVTLFIDTLVLTATTMLYLTESEKQN